MSGKRTRVQVDIGDTSQNSLFRCRLQKHYRIYELTELSSVLKICVYRRPEPTAQHWLHKTKWDLCYSLCSAVYPYPALNPESVNDRW